MINNLRNTLQFYAANLQNIDFIVIAWFFLLFLFLLIISFLMVKKYPIFSAFIVFFDIFLLIFGGIYIKNYMDNSLRPKHIEINKIQQLNYTNTLIIDINVTNSSKNPFTICKINVKILKDYNNSFKNIFYSLKPMAEQTIYTNKEIPPKKTDNFLIIFEKFKYNDKFNTSVSGECF